MPSCSCRYGSIHVWHAWATFFIAELEAAAHACSGCASRAREGARFLLTPAVLESIVPAYAPARHAHPRSDFARSPPSTVRPSAAGAWQRRAGRQLPAPPRRTADPLTGLALFISPDGVPLAAPPFIPLPPPLTVTVQTKTLKKNNAPSPPSSANYYSKAYYIIPIPGSDPTCCKCSVARVRTLRLGPDLSNQSGFHTEAASNDNTPGCPIFYMAIGLVTLAYD